MDPTYPLVPISNVIACVLITIPLFHMVTRSWNTGVYVFALWTFLLSFSYTVNTIIWSNNVEDKAPVWCDISSHIQILANVGVPASSLIITRRLYNITKLQGAMISKGKQRIELFLELAFCIGLPIVIAGLYYVVQGSRYEILEELGCHVGEVFSGVSVILIDSWTILFPVISLFFFSPRIICTFFRRRREMKEYLNSRDEGMSQSHLYRMLTLGCFDNLITLPIGVTQLIVIVIGEGPQLVLYQGWSLIHSDLEPILIPKSIWSTNKWDTFGVHWNEWLNPFYAMVFFALFGLTSEAKEGYRRFFRFLGWPFGTEQKTSGEALPEAVFARGRGGTATTISNSTSR